MQRHLGTNILRTFPGFGNIFSLEVITSGIQKESFTVPNIIYAVSRLRFNIYILRLSEKAKCQARDNLEIHRSISSVHYDFQPSDERVGSLDWVAAGRDAPCA